MSIFNSRGSLICALFTAFTVVLSGCASTGSSLLSSDSTITTASGEVISVDPRLTEGDEAKFFSRSGFQACTASAAVGILACMVSNSSNKALCSVAAGVAACGVAMGTNYYFDQRRAQYSNTATRLDKIDEDIKSDTNRIVKRTETAQAVINDNKKTLAQIIYHHRCRAH